jgi:uncharacterized protein YcfJ
MRVKHVRVGVAALAAVGLLGACAQPPLGPTVAVMPAANKPFPVFQQEDGYCRQFAQQQTAGTAEAANNAQVGTAIIGTVLGAGLGAALGGGRGAAVGAGAGALGGTAVGANQAERGAYSGQQRYNIAYSQCMYAYGNQVQGPARYYVPYYAAPPPPGAYYPPPPPPGAYYPPPPPPPTGDHVPPPPPGPPPAQ